MLCLPYAEFFLLLSGEFCLTSRIGATIHIGQEMLCLPYAVFFSLYGTFGGFLVYLSGEVLATKNAGKLLHHHG